MTHKLKVKFRLLQASLENIMLNTISAAILSIIVVPVVVLLASLVWAQIKFYWDLLH